MNNFVGVHLARETESRTGVYCYDCTDGTTQKITFYTRRPGQDETSLSLGQPYFSFELPSLFTLFQ